MKLLNVILFIFALIIINVQAQNNILKDSLKTIISNLEDKYKINIYYDTKLPDSIYLHERKYILAPDSDLVELYEYVKLFEKEFNKYPVDLIKKVNLKYIAIVKEITNSNGRIRTAVPDRVNEVLYLQYPQNNNNTQYFKHIIHHEFYHMIEEEINGSAFYKDPVWALFNESSFIYGKGGNAIYDNNKINSYEMSHPMNGFINLYATSSKEEDKAEIFAILFVETERIMIEEWAKTDIICKFHSNRPPNSNLN